MAGLKAAKGANPQNRGCAFFGLMAWIGSIDRALFTVRHAPYSGLGSGLAEGVPIRHLTKRNATGNLCLASFPENVERVR